jgi:hypothetical protein
MTAILPELPTVLDELPPMAVTATPVILPDLLAGIGVTERRTPRWITDPALIADIVAGFAEIPDELNPQEEP